MRKLFFCLFSSLIAISNIYSMNLDIVDKHLDNRNCKSGVCYRNWEDAFLKKGIEIEPGDRSFIKHIVWHYTVSRSVAAVYDEYNNAGVSAHFTLERNGIVYKSVDPNVSIAFHAGQSHFGGLDALNYHSIGVEHINPGYCDEYVVFPNFPKPRQLQGDSRWWYPFSEEQFQASCILTANLQREFKIPGCNVVTHADISIGRKSDIGPLWDYKRAYTEYNTGYWYDETHQVKSDIIENLDDEDFVKIIEAIGYTSDNKKQLIKAYKLHYVCSEISDDLTYGTKEIILKHAIGLKDYVFPITGEKYGYFETQIKNWADNADPGKVARLTEYFNL